MLKQMQYRFVVNFGHSVPKFCFDHTNILEEYFVAQIAACWSLMLAGNTIYATNPDNPVQYFAGLRLRGVCFKPPFIFEKNPDPEYVCRSGIVIYWALR